jgi:deoxyribonuclease V
MIAAFDVHYLRDERASAAAVLFHNYTDAESAMEFVGLTDGVSPYIPGQFYRRELPCILSLLEQFDQAPDEMLIDGYVMLGDRPGLGQHLFESFSGKIPVIGVAKSKYRSSSGVEVFRGGSKRPLYVTSAGVDPHEASERIRLMHGAHRVPALLKRVDLLARGKIRCSSCERVEKVGH